MHPAFGIAEQAGAGLHAPLFALSNNERACSETTLHPPGDAPTAPAAPPPQVVHYNLYYYCPVKHPVYYSYAPGWSPRVSEP